MSKKLDPELRSLLKRWRAQSDFTTEVSPSRRVPEQVELIVQFSGDIADLIAIGFEPRSVMENAQQGYKIATGRIPVGQLEQLAAIEHIIEAEGPQDYHPMLDYSLPEIRAVAVHNGSPSRKGRGVVIGIIDSGIDWRHGDFINAADNSSRILAIWDQMLPASAGETAGPGTPPLGVQYTQDQITQALQGTFVVRTLDKNARNETSGHGTHVAGIAAGNGNPASCCARSGTYVGVAPEAELIVVRYAHGGELGTNIHIVDAMTYVFNHPRAAGKPVVVNISQGQNRGPHDGTSVVEQAIDTQVLAGAGRAVVVAAGNHADERCHVKGSVPGNNHKEIEFEIREGHEYNAYLDLWYDRAGSLNIEVIAEGNISSPVVNHGNDLPNPFVANPTADNDHKVYVDINGKSNGAHGRDNNFRISIDKPSSGNIPKGNWKLKLTNPNAGAVNFHCWIERGDKAPVFLPENTPGDRIHASSDSTLSTPSTAAQAITVANHYSKTDCCDCSPSTGIVESSGRGPVARVSNIIKKPDIAAPGVQIASAKADAANLKGNCWSCCPDACCCLYKDDWGTSMSAPHVAGAIALMLEEKPTMNKVEILQHLQDSARDKPAGGRDDAFGAGKLNVEAAIGLIRSAGGGGGGGGGGPHPFMPVMDGDPIGLPSLLGSERDSGKRSSSNAEVSSSSDSRQLPPAIRILRARMNAIPNGGSVVAAVSRHFSEVRRLINTNRRVATMWHRSDGPRMMRRLVRGALDDDAPAAFLTERQRAYFHRMFDLLVRYGSPRLRQSIDRYRDMIFVLLETPLASQIMTEMAGSHA